MWQARVKIVIPIFLGTIPVRFASLLVLAIVHSYELRGSGNVANIFLLILTWIEQFVYLKNEIKQSGKLIKANIQ